MQKETQKLPGTKVVGFVDLTKFEKKQTPEPPVKRNQKPANSLSVLSNFYVDGRGRIKMKKHY